VAIHATVTAVLSSLSRPLRHIDNVQNLARTIDRHIQSLRRSDRWGLGGLLEETRKHNQAEVQKKIDAVKQEMMVEGSELRYTQQTVAAELAGWQEQHRKMARRAMRTFAEGMVVREKERLEGIKRALRCVTDSTSSGP